MSNTKKLFSQIIKFGFVGGTAFVIDAGLLFLLTEFCGIHYLISGMISFIFNPISCDSGGMERVIIMSYSFL